MAPDDAVIVDLPEANDRSAGTSINVSVDKSRRVPAPLTLNKLPSRVAEYSVTGRTSCAPPLKVKLLLV